MKVIDDFLSPKDFQTISDEILGRYFQWMYWHLVSDWDDKDNDEDEKIGHINIDSSGGININSEFGWSLAKLIVSKVREK